MKRTVLWNFKIKFSSFSIDVKQNTDVYSKYSVFFGLDIFICDGFQGWVEIGGQCHKAFPDQISWFQGKTI